MKRLKLFYMFTSLFTFMEISLLIVIIWETMKVMKTSLYLGIVLSISSLLVYFFKKFFARRLSINKFIIDNFLLSIFMLIVLIININIEYSLLILIFLTGALNFIRLSTFNSENTKLVLDGVIDKTKASKIMQTSVQIGAFSGSFVGSFLIANYDFKLIFYIYLVVNVVLSLSLLFTYKISSTDKKEKSEKEESKTQDSSHNEHIKMSGYLISLLLIMGLIGFHISAFNILVPTIFQFINHWDATSYGMASGIAGVGAFLASLVYANKKNVVVILSFTLIIADYILAFIGIEPLSIGIAFIIGFSINFMRIDVSLRLIEISKTKQIADVVSQKSTLFYSLFNGVAPAIVAIIISKKLLGVNYANDVFLVIPVIIFLLVIYMFKRGKNEKFSNS